jgi:hypothetical protein
MLALLLAQHLSGHPSGGVIWAPLSCVIAATVLSIYSMATCTWATFSNGQSTKFTGYGYYHNDATPTFGLFTFQVDSEWGGCYGYNWSVLNKDGFWLSAQVFGCLSGVCGCIIICWLLTSTCCPIRPSHKTSLIVLSLLAFVFSGFTFLFYGNEYCSEFGCSLASAAWCQISGTILYLITAGALILVKAENTSCVLEQKNQNRDEQSMIEENPTFALAEAVLEPAVTGVAMEEK